MPRRPRQTLLAAALAAAAAAAGMWLGLPPRAAPPQPALPAALVVADAALAPRHAEAFERALAERGFRVRLLPPGAGAAEVAEATRAEPVPPVLVGLGAEGAAAVMSADPSAAARVVVEPPCRVRSAPTEPVLWVGHRAADPSCRQALYSGSAREALPRPIFAEGAQPEGAAKVAREAARWAEARAAGLAGLNPPAP